MSIVFSSVCACFVERGRGEGSGKGVLYALTLYLFPSGQEGRGGSALSEGRIDRDDILRIVWKWGSKLITPLSSTSTLTLFTLHPNNLSIRTPFSIDDTLLCTNRDRYTLDPTLFSTPRHVLSPNNLNNTQQCRSSPSSHYSPFSLLHLMRVNTVPRVDET